MEKTGKEDNRTSVSEGKEEKGGKEMISGRNKEKEIRGKKENQENESM